MNMLAVGPEPDWAQLSKEWEDSGVSQRAFCEQRGLLHSRFCYKRSELLKSGDAVCRQNGRLSRPSVVDFLPVAVEVEEGRAKTGRSSSPDPEIEVELPFGVVLRFRGVQQR